MATMVGRTIWVRCGASIHLAKVTRQIFNPDITYAIRDDGVECQLSPMSYFLTPQAAIADAREHAELILYFASKLEESLDPDPFPHITRLSALYNAPNPEPVDCGLEDAHNSRREDDDDSPTACN